MACLYEYNGEWITEEQLRELYSPVTRLYRSEYDITDLKGVPDWLSSQPAFKNSKDASGRWFYSSLKEAQDHQTKFGGSNISFIDIPTKDLETFNAKNNKFAGGYGKDGNEYFVTPEIASTRQNINNLLQIQGTESSKASSKTLSKVKEFLKRIGVEIKDLRYDGVNGVASILDKIIQITEGKENIALPEEASHFVVEILKQSKDPLYTKMLNKIGSYGLYQQVLDTYSQEKAYQKDGKPDIIKLKEEAIGKVLAEYWMKSLEGFTEKPELLNQTSNWWESIKNFFKSLINKNFNPFEQVVSKIDSLTSESIGKNLVDKIDFSKMQGIYGAILKSEAEKGNYAKVLSTIKDQLNPLAFDKTVTALLNGDTELGREILNSEFYSKPVDDAYTKFIEEDKKIALLNQGTNDRHYTYNGERVAKTVTGKIDSQDNKKFTERTPEQKIADEARKLWGSEGHNFAEEYFKTLIDDQGFALKNPKDVKVPTTLPSNVQQVLKEYFKSLIATYPEGTRFAVEKKVVNTKEKGLLASTMDFVAFIPDAKLGVKVDILDWKFMDLNKSKDADVPWYKSDKWKKQMGEYITIAKQYGVKPEQLNKTRMVPFIASYTKENKLKSLEIGNIDTVKETKLYLLPVPSDLESTGNVQIDSLLIKLKAQYEKLVKLPVSEESKQDKKTKLDQLSTAIRRLQVQGAFAPLANESLTFGNSAKKVVDSFKLVDFTKLDPKEIENQLGELLRLNQSIETYLDLDDVYLSAYPKDTQDVDQKKLLKAFESNAQAFERLQGQIKDIQRRAVASIAINEGILNGTVAEVTEKITSPELEIGMLAKSFKEVTKLPAKIIQLAGNLYINRKSQQYQEEKSLVHEFNNLLTPYLEATTSFANPLDAIKQKDSLKLIPKINKQFWKDLQEAKEAKNKKFFLENVDLEKYNALAQEKLDKDIKNIEDTTWNADKTENEQIISKKIAELMNSIDLDSDGFNGWYSYDFDYLFKKAFNEEKNYSPEYLSISKSPALINMWNFYTSLNERGRKSGYIDRQGLNFLPLIEGTIMEKLSKSQDIFKTSKEILKEGYILNVNEQTAHAKFNKETGELEKNVPKLFTRTNKDENLMSSDMTKITAPWISALLQYEASRELENTLLTLSEVEESKGHLQLGPNKEVIFEGSSPKEFSGNKNADLLEKIINDSIFGISEDSNTLFDAVINKTKGTDEEKQIKKVQGKKILQGTNRLTQSLATGFKLMVSVPNFAGGNLQASINSGNFYTKGEFLKNELKVCASLNNTGLIDKALIDVIHPLNEDVRLDNTRSIAKKQSTAKYLATWSIQDVAQSANRLGDMVLELTNAKTMNDNSMVVDGKIVNIRQYLQKQDSGKYGMTESERKAVEKSFESRVQELKDTKSLAKIAKFNEEGYLEIPGVSARELAKYRTFVVENARNISGLMSRDNKADYTRSTIFKSFMMFKNWIPKQVELRTSNIQKNNELNTWEYGRTRLFMKTWMHLGTRRIFEMRDIIAGNDNGLRIMDEILEEKRQAYYKATGQELEITTEEFYDMMRKELHSQSKELVLLLGVMSLYLGSKVAVPDKDDDLARNRYTWWRKMISKIKDELAFYYSPSSADSITRGSIVPSLGLLNKVSKLFTSLEEETRGHIMDDQKLIDKSHPLKYFLNLIPGPAQFQNEILPYISPEMAKEQGIKLTDQARQGN